MSEFQLALNDEMARKRLIDKLTMGYDWNWHAGKPLPPPEIRRTKVKPWPSVEERIQSRWVLKNYD